MAQVQDPVCGMMVDTSSAAATSEFEGETYFFCSASCKTQFDANPAKFVGSVISASPVDTDPPHTHTKHMTSPKFGSAGSGGAEFERIREDPDDAKPSRAAPSRGDRFREPKE